MFSPDLFGTTSVACRTAVVPACDGDIQAGAALDALATLALRKRDKLDFTVDFSVWAEANGKPNMSAAPFSVATGSPKSPTIVSQGFSAQGRATIVLAVPMGGGEGDAYYLDVVATFDAVPAANPGDVAIGARQLTRRINVVVVPG